MASLKLFMLVIFMITTKPFIQKVVRIRFLHIQKHVKNVATSNLGTMKVESEFHALEDLLHVQVAQFVNTVIKYIRIKLITAVVLQHVQVAQSVSTAGLLMVNPQATTVGMMLPAQHPKPALHVVQQKVAHLVTVGMGLPVPLPKLVLFVA